MCVCVYLTTPTHEQNTTLSQFFKRSSTNLNSEFSFSWTGYYTKVKVPTLLHHLSIAGGRIIGFMPFQKVIALYEMQTASSRIWTWFVVSISYDDKHYPSSTLETWRNLMLGCCVTLRLLTGGEASQCGWTRKKFRVFTYILGNHVSLFNGISTLMGYLMSKPSLFKNSSDTT